MADLRNETRRILTTYEPASGDEAASALEGLWSQVPTTAGGAALIKAEVREELKALGVPVPALDEIGREIGAIARKRVDDFLPLAGLLWGSYGREGRLVASTFLGAMELAAPEKVIPVIEELAPTCLTWEDCDQLAMRALEPVVRRDPETYLRTVALWIEQPNKWVRRTGVIVVGRLPMKRPEYTAECLRLVEPALGDDDLDVRRAVSFAIRVCVRGDLGAVVTFIKGQVHRTDPASIWVLSDVIRSMTKKFLPQFKELLPLYENWLTQVDPKSQRSVASAVKILRSA